VTGSATTSPYGAWTSPYTSESLVSGVVRLGTPLSAAGSIWWTESRPTEAGRTVIVRRSPDGSTTDVTPAPFNARTRVHEYGGGAAVFAADGTVYASNFTDQKIHRIAPGATPEPLTHADGMRYADADLDPGRNRLVCVREDHTGGGEAVNTVVAVDLASGDETVVAEGHDFFAAPRMSPDGRWLCWLAWDHPNMPWDGCVLYIAEVDTLGAVSPPIAIAGGREESITQPTWAPDGTLYFTSDRSGYWNIHRLRDGEVSAVHRTDAEFGAPAWVFGMTTFAVLDASRLAAVYVDKGNWRLVTIDTRTGRMTEVPTPYTVLEEVAAHRGRVLAVAQSATVSETVVLIDPDSGAVEIVKRDSDTEVDERYISVAQPVEFPTEDGLTAYGYYYPPVNPDHAAPDGELPPLVVWSHGGPTGMTVPAYNPHLQYWTSRGFAVLDVDYGGSAGYGRAYRQRLAGRWGIVDVDDCCNGARYLAGKGMVDPGRLAIRGGSAGGYTTLSALTFRDVFAAGASLFGVGDLAGLATETHKFESRYLDSLVGPYPRDRAVYEERSPVHHVDRLNCPIIFFQGLDDKVVAPNQAERMVEALNAKGVPVAYLPFEGEGHGFRRADTIKRSNEAELYFYSRIFGFTPAGDIAPVDVANL